MVTLSIERGEKAVKSLIKMRNAFKRYAPDFDKETRKYYQEYIRYGEALASQGVFEKDGRTMPWCKFNFRYGSFSIEGTLAEMFSVWMWNSMFTDTRLKLGSSSKEDECKGIDLTFVNESWMNEYVGQCKKSRITSETASIHDSIWNYNLSEVHRLILSDPQRKRIVVCDYLHLLRLRDCGNIMESPCYNGYIRVLVSYEQLKKHDKTIILELVDGKVRMV